MKIITIYKQDTKKVIFKNRRIELLLKYKIQQKLKDTLIIHLDNWLWKPVCNDNTVSINPRLCIKELNLT